MGTCSNTKEIDNTKPISRQEINFHQENQFINNPYTGNNNQILEGSNNINSNNIAVNNQTNQGKHFKQSKIY